MYFCAISFYAISFTSWIIFIRSVLCMELVLNCSTEIGFAIKNMSDPFKSINRQSALHQCFKNNLYDITQLPLLGEKVVEIRYSFDVINIISLENDGTIVLVADFDFGWVDEFRKWNSSELLGLESIYIPTQEIWTPEFVLSNCESDNCVYGANNQTRAKLFSDGVASLMLLRKKFVATCEIDLSTFPYDSQKCTLTFQVFFQLKNSYISDAAIKIRNNCGNGRPKKAKNNPGD